jgi:PAS domain-containing protein
MMTEPPAQPTLLRDLLDAIPSYILAVDEDLGVLEYNTAAAALLGESREEVLLLRGGEVLDCIHALDIPAGCGQGEACRSCVVRGAVREAFAGRATVRRRARMQLRAGDRVNELYVLLTASPFAHGGRRMVLLVLEDMSEMVELQRIVPICAYCRKVRDDDQYWTRVESYFERHWDLRFTHGICPECLKAQMADIVREPL